MSSDPGAREVCLMACLAVFLLPKDHPCCFFRPLRQPEFTVDQRWGAAQPHVAGLEFRYSAGMNGNIFTTALEFLDKYNGAVTAVATAIIAIFTIVLVRVTGRQARLTTAALNLARQEFVATHRPRVVVRYIQGPNEDREGRQFYWVTFVNIGANPAIIEAFGADLAKRSDETGRWAPPGLDAEPKEISPIVLTSGQRHTFIVTARDLPEALVEIQIFREGVNDYQLCAVGVIRYSDGNGVARDTGFFRVLDDEGNSFVLSEHDSEMEYQD
jgi:hypothetical protein